MDARKNPFLNIFLKFGYHDVNSQNTRDTFYFLLVHTIVCDLLAR